VPSTVYFHPVLTVRSYHCHGLAQRNSEDAAQLVELLDVRAGKMLLGDLHSELRAKIMDLLPAEWLHRAVADTVHARCALECPVAR
jgi:hypothetical protein